MGNFNEPFGPKWVELVILGQPLAPDRAAEILRRTDGGFHWQLFRLSDYGRTVRRLLGFPDDPELAADHDAARAAIDLWHARWGGLRLQWLRNNLLLHGQGWCHADGSIAFAADMEDYMRANELLDDCQRLAAAFPDLVMTVAAWGDGKMVLGQPLTEAPESPWPPELMSRQIDPTFGFLIEAGAVTVLPGANPWLFDRFGLTTEAAVERAVSESRRCERELIRPTDFGDRGIAAGLPDSIIRAWQDRALELGLVAHDEG